MGQRITQRIFTCSQCDYTPNDGEPVWDMDREYWCEDCIEYYGEEYVPRSDTEDNT